MARLEEMPDEARTHLLDLPCPTFDHTPWVPGPLLTSCRLALVSTAGLHRRGDRPFEPGALDYRIIPRDASGADLVMSHISANFDRTGFQQDWNVVFPLDRLRELTEKGIVGDLADYHYSFMGATDPLQMEGIARSLAQVMKANSVDAVLLVPV